MCLLSQQERGNKEAKSLGTQLELVMLLMVPSDFAFLTQFRLGGLGRGLAVD